MLDDPVLAGRVHRLEHDEERITVVGVEERLGGGEVGDGFVEDDLRLLLDRVAGELLRLLAAGPRGIVILESNLRLRRHEEKVEILFGWPRFRLRLRSWGSLAAVSYHCHSRKRREQPRIGEIFLSCVPWPWHKAVGAGRSEASPTDSLDVLGRVECGFSPQSHRERRASSRGIEPNRKRGEMHRGQLARSLSARSCFLCLPSVSSSTTPCRAAMLCVLCDSVVKILTPSDRASNT